MNRIFLLESLKEYTEKAVADLIMPVSMQRGDEEQGYKTADVHLMRLPDGAAARKKAPYIIHQLITGTDVQRTGLSDESSVMIRSIFCVYNNNEEEGSLMLLNLMERLRVELLKDRVLAKQYTLDLGEEGLQCLIYPDDTAPYYAGEMASIWKTPAVVREVRQWL